jgi:two-component system response regulator HydG
VLTKEFMVSELFGHAPGAFTGARAGAKEGLFQAANGGTIFLDEIGNLEVEAQTRLLRVLQDGVIRPLQDTKDIKVNVRVLAATNADLQQAIAGGMFREDLYFRLKVIEIKLPSLNERREDIPRLAYHFLRRHTARNGKTIRNISAPCMDVLRAHDWKGNIRELDNAIERAVIVESADELAPKSLPPDVGAKEATGLSYDPMLGQVDLELTMREAMERAETAFRVVYLRGLMNRYKNVAAAARHADVERSNFRRLLKRYSIEYEKGHVAARGEDDDDDE